MRNPNFNLDLREFGVAWRFLTVALLLLFFLSVHSLDVDSGRNHTLEWEVLTKRNFSSQIRLHQHILLMVTVPWSGESRTLMREVAHAAHGPEKLDNLKLMVIYKNKERMLADALDATETTTIFCYYHSVPYKYQGRLRAQHILASVNYLMHLHPEELPLKSINTPEDLDTFLQSTDKAILLLEFCGWSRKLLSKWKTNGTENAFLVQDTSDGGIIIETNFFGETNQTLTSSVNKNLKDLKSEKLTCGVENGLSGNPLLGDYMSANHSIPSWTENSNHDVGRSCSFEEFQRFESFFLKLTKFAQEFFLPPERRRFGLISEQSLLPSLGVQVPGSWSVILHHAGCPNCSKIFEEGDDLKTVLQMHPSLVAELETEGHDSEFGLPAEKPSIILFIDRCSESPTTRRNSKEALEAFRKFALQNQFYQMALQNSIMRGKHFVQSFREVRSRTPSDPSEHPRKEFSPFTRIDEMKNKISVMIINEGRNLALDDASANTQDSSVQDIFAYLLQQKKKAKLSLLAKEVGFQLLSDAFEVKITDLVPSQTDNGEANKMVPEAPMEKTAESGIKLEDNVPIDATTSTMEPEEQTGHANLDPSQPNENKLTYIVSNSKLIPQAAGQIAMNSAVSFAQGTKVDESFSLSKELDVEGRHDGFDGFYFFIDGSCQLLRSLTSGSKIPSMIILDPVSEQHYVFPEDEIFTYSSIHGFLDAFLNGTLVPYQKSEYGLKRPREAIRPPFVNLDFHEVDPIPRVTAHTFSKMVLGLNESDTQNIDHAWMKDVLVLFSNSWCGFCQRMELVVREVFRAFNRYMNTLKSGSKKRDLIFISETMGGTSFTDPPLIFLMDCTLNDCSLLLKSLGQKELYPTLMLFPAQRKNAITYHGDMSVTSVIKFIADHGTNSPHPGGGKGQDGNRNWVPSEVASPPPIHEEAPVSEGKYNNLLLMKTAPRRAIKFQKTGSRPSDDSLQVVVGTVLVATDKLLIAPPFDASLILIVQADHAKGFQGLIINKQISWDPFKGLETGVEQIRQASLSFGGPVILQEMPLVCLTQRVPKEGYAEVLPNVYFLDQLATIQEIEWIKTGNRSAEDYWFFLGYSSWGWDQLYTEIAEGSWRISDDPIGQLHWPGN